MSGKITIKALREAWWQSMYDEIDRLRAERDEARRELCVFYCANDTDWMSGPFPMRQSTPAMFAKLKGWNCFKDKP